MVGEGNNFLPLRLVRNLGTAEHDAELRRDALEHGDDFRGFHDVPNINAKADDERLAGEDAFDDFERALVDVELGKLCAFAQVAHVRQEVAEAEGGVDVFGVECRENDVRHGSVPNKFFQPEFLHLIASFGSAGTANFRELFVDGECAAPTPLPF